jgi:anaerobic dimethyl sulfoxide reductase subunit B (iron-sulfur subunit)
MGFYYNQDNCTGCKTCQIACKDVNNLEPGALFREVREIEAGKFPDPKAFFISMSCNHCASPACMAVCPAGAIGKSSDTGVVFIDQNICIGCKLCVSACPYGAPAFIEAEGKTFKCEFCAGRVEKDELPACVASCQLRVIEYGEIESLRAKYGICADVYSLPESSATNPSVTIKTHRSLR